MKKDMKKVMGYARGDVVTLGGVGGDKGDEITRGMPMRRSRREEILDGIPNQGGMDVQSESDSQDPKPKPKFKPKRKPRKPVKKMGGGMMKYGHGGSVKGGKPRGCGVARQGVRKAKMVVM
tara:strand:+ start:1615 stop:1977 length:363 start_codon:yes stop_codon:yes gene_type:complete